MLIHPTVERLRALGLGDETRKPVRASISPPAPRCGFAPARPSQTHSIAQSRRRHDAKQCTVGDIPGRALTRNSAAGCKAGGGYGSRAPRTRDVAVGSAQLLAPEGLPDDPDDCHQDTAANASRGDLPDDRADVEAAAGGVAHGSGPSATRAPDQGADDLRPRAAANHAGNGIADRAKVDLPHQRADDVTADPARN